MKRRSRIVSFRLSDEEFDSLKNVTNSRGARSVSEFTRSVACNMNAGEDGSGKIGDSLRTLNARMEALVHKIETLTDALEGKNATDSTDLKEKEPAYEKSDLPVVVGSDSADGQRPGKSRIRPAARAAVRDLAE